MYLTIYLFKKIYFMVLSDRGRETERPYSLCVKYKGKIILLNKAHDGRPILMKEENSIEN